MNYRSFIAYVVVILQGSLMVALSGCTGKQAARDTFPQELVYSEEVPGYTAAVFESRRQRVMEGMEGQIALVSAAAAEDFYYLTGMKEERGIAVLDPQGEHPFILFVLPDDPMATLWTGERYGVKGAMERFGADTAYPLESFDRLLPELLTGKETVSLLRGDPSLAEQVETLQMGKAGCRLSYDLTPLVHEMRVVKDAWEISQLEKAIDVTCFAQQRVLQTVMPGQKEYEVQAEIEYVFLKNGLRPGFETITGSGPNAATLHYYGNERTLQEGDLLLMDIGAACNGYTADVTRTIPVSGAFTPEQKELYNLVLKAQEEAIRLMVPGQKILDCHHRAADVIVQGLYELGLVTDTTSWWQRRFYIHYRNDHYIGLNVHDVGSYGDFDETVRDLYAARGERGREILPGMVLTMEPGIYLIADRLDHLQGLFGEVATEEELAAFAEKVRPAYEKYAGIGIRIEDDILVTETGNRVLSHKAPKTVEEIQAAMR
ncbi:MAG: aminopeptidase P N-terminal domain-containing protein [Bacteroidales bacterium]